eukprot:942764-Prorocentrum_minimum.AAC.2
MVRRWAWAGVLQAAGRSQLLPNLTLSNFRILQPTSTAQTFDKGLHQLVRCFSVTPSHRSTSGVDPLETLWFKNGASFSCTECGRCAVADLCCKGRNKAVYVNGREVDELAASLGIPTEVFNTAFRLCIRLRLHPAHHPVTCWPLCGAFVQLYLREVQGRAALVQNDSKDACVFLENNRCGVYQARPTQCRTYPFWRENVLTAHDWETEATACEGISPAAEPTVSGAEVAANVIYEEVRPPSARFQYQFRAIVNYLDRPPLVGGFAIRGSATR